MLLKIKPFNAIRKLFCRAFIISLISIPETARASDPQVAIKTNLLYDATATINLGTEFEIAPMWSFDISGNFNAWTMGNGRLWRHWMVQPEFRYWFCNPFQGHFVGIEAQGGQFNFGKLNTDFSFLGTDFSKLRDTRYQGWFVGAGISYGYTWILGRHWNFEAEIGIGYNYVRYDRYPCTHCGTKIESDKSHHYVGPTKAVLNLVYVF